MPPVDAARLQPVQVPAGHMPMLATAAEEAATVELPYVAAEFGELSASETARLIAKSIATPLSLPEWMVLEVKSQGSRPTHRSIG